MPETTDEAPITAPEEQPRQEDEARDDARLEERVEQLEQAFLELLERLPGEPPPEEPEESESAGDDEIAPATVGRIVVYHTTVQSFPAIVTRAYQTGAVDLVVFGGPSGPAGVRNSVLPGAAGENHRWSWPERT